MKTITFPRRYAIEGFEAILFAGTVVPTTQMHVYHVPESTLRVLDEQKIPYKVLDNWQPDSKHSKRTKR
jgi:hypothetical protein